MSHEVIAYRPPAIEDGASIWQMVHDSGVLDANSPYCYLLLCRHFSQTCAVAETQGKIVGFVTSYIPPGREDTLFVWQVGVSNSMHGRGIATRLLQELLRRKICRGLNFLEATVGPSNMASRALFTALARRLNTELCEKPCFQPALFPQGNHEPENLFRIGPFSVSKHI